MGAGIKFCTWNDRNAVPWGYLSGLAERHSFLQDTEFISLKTAACKILVSGKHISPRQNSKPREKADSVLRRSDSFGVQTLNLAHRTTETPFRRDTSFIRFGGTARDRPLHGEFLNLRC